MFSKENITIGLLSILVLMVGFGFFYGGNNSIGAYDEGFSNFTKLKAIDAFTSEGTTVISGGATLSGVNTLSGATTVLQTASTTLTIGSATNVGCIALGSASGTAIVYLSASTTAAGVAVNTTKPSYCK